MFTQKAFADALQGNDSELVEAAGPDGIVVVAPELSAAVAVGDQVVVGRQAGDGVELHPLALPDDFEVCAVTTEAGQFFVTARSGWVVHGTPDELIAGDLDEILFNPFGDMPAADFTLSAEFVPAIAEAGEVYVPLRDGHVWISFDHARPDQVLALVPRARALLASFEQHGRTGAEYLLELMLRDDDEEDQAEEEEEEDGEFDPEDFLATMAPTGLVIHEDGDFAIHYEGASDGEYFLDNYWPSVRFDRAGTAVGWTMEA